jgi:hypothetical protein
MMLAVSIAIDHSAVNREPKLLCALACTCKGLRAAVQQCSSCNTDAAFTMTKPTTASFALWLSKHAALLRSLDASVDSGFFRRETHREAQWQLAQALEAAAAAAPTTAASASKQQQQGMQLTSFSIDRLLVPAVLSALPAHSMTLLDITLDQDSLLGGVPGALAGLSNLQQLRLQGGYGLRDDAYSCLPGIAALKQLSVMTLLGFKLDSQPLQQLLLEPLPLRQLHLAGPGYRLCKSLHVAALTQLTRFSLDEQLPADAVLPPQLLALQIGGWLNDLSLPVLLRLPQLHTLGMRVACREPGAVLCLTHLQSLQCLALQYINAYDAVATAAAWPQLPLLQQLRLEFHHPHGVQTDDRQLAVILSQLAAAPGLTKLKLSAHAVSVHGEQFERCPPPQPVVLRVWPCAALAAVSRLRDLSFLKGSALDTGDALALTALTGLTRLVLAGVGSGVGGEVAAALAAALTQLRHLDLQHCDLGSMECLQKMGQLRNLTELRLEGSGQLVLQDLMQLTGLWHLQQLGLSSDQVAAGDLQTFWAAVTQLIHVPDQHYYD